MTEAAGPATARLAIRPYPKELEEPIPLGDGRTLLLRPILPEDEPSLQGEKYGCMGGVTDCGTAAALPPPYPGLD